MVKTFLSPENFGCKQIGSQKMLGQKDFGSKKIRLEKFWSKEILCPKYFGSEKILDQKYFSAMPIRSPIGDLGPLGDFLVNIGPPFVPYYIKSPLFRFLNLKKYLN